MEPAIDDSVVNRRSGIRLKIRLRTLLLLLAVIAVWAGFWRNLENIWDLRSRISRLRPRPDQFVVLDPNQITVLKEEELSYNAQHWKIHLPDDAYRICVATRGIDAQGFTLAKQHDILSAGEHRIGLLQQFSNNEWQIIVSVDRVQRMTIREPLEWGDTLSSYGGAEFLQCTQLPADQSLVLIRRRFRRLDTSKQTITPAGPTDGVMLWIERNDSSHH
jgi:hypothetical protein